MVSHELRVRNDPIIIFIVEGELVIHLLGELKDLFVRDPLGPVGGSWLVSMVVLHWEKTQYIVLKGPISFFNAL